jgi:hypothetical protein
MIQFYNDVLKLPTLYNKFLFIPLIRGSKTPTSQLKKIEKFSWGIKENSH